MKRDYLSEVAELRMALRRVMGEACDRYPAEEEMLDKAKAAILALDQFRASLRECQMEVLLGQARANGEGVGDVEAPEHAF